MKWTQIRVTCKTEHIDDVAAVLTVLDTGVMIEDYSDVLTSLRTVYGELIDEKILNADKTIASASIYASDKKTADDYVDFISSRLASLGIKADIATAELDEEDWSTAWRKFYKPTKIGKHIVIVPSWEKYEKQDGDIIIDMDPGMAFGTGTHETTRLCATLLEENVKPGDYMLDVGAGSGILAILALMYGAKHCVGTDLDPCSVMAVKENMEANNIPLDSFRMMIGNIIDDKEVMDSVGYECYDIVMANILAPVLIELAPIVVNHMKKGGVFITSGIIEGKEDSVCKAMEAAGLKVVEVTAQGEWRNVTARKD